MTDEFAALLRRGDLLDVTLRRRYDSDPADVWDALTTPERLARWLAPVSGELRAGGRYRIDFDADDPAQQVTGTITACEPPARLVVSWEIHQSGTSEVVATIAAHGVGCELVIEHHGLPEAMAAGYAAGWHAYGDTLEAELAGAAPPSWDERWEALFGTYRTIAAGT